MNKKIIFIYIKLAFLSLGFILISLPVRFRKNNSSFLSHKIKLGATIITMTYLLSACSGNTQTEPDTCYKSASNDSDSTALNKDTLKNEIKDTVKKNISAKKSKTSSQKDTIIKEPPVPEITCYMIAMPDDTI